MTPLITSDWKRVTFIHYEVDPKLLRAPFELDLFGGKAYVSIVAFRMERFRLGLAPSIRPMPDHHFLNVRTYVRHSGVPAVYFLAEWIDSSSAVLMGPRIYGLPYRFGTHRYDDAGGTVAGRSGRFVYRRSDPAAFLAAPPGSLDEFLLERYRAITLRAGICRRFQVRHKPWPQARVDATVDDASLLDETGDWVRHARLAGAHYSPGVLNVSIGRPQRITLAGNPTSGAAGS